MAENQRTVLVLGATGRQGGSVARAMLQARWHVRAVVRDLASPTAISLREMGVDLVPGDLTDIGTVRAAMQGAYGVFSVLPGYLAAEDEVRIGTAIADVAVEHGVAHFVYSSGASVGETRTGVARFDAKPRVEAHIRELSIAATIVRPVIFMEMLLVPVYGLDEGRFTFLVQPDQAMQLIAVQDIGKFVAAIFADRDRFGGEILKIAGDTVTGRDLAAAFSDAFDRPIAYSQIPNDARVRNPDIAHMIFSLEYGPLSRHVDLTAMREINPAMLSFRSWLAMRELGSLKRPVPDAGPTS